MPGSSPRHQVCIVACARWETQAITEWLLYHRSIGFDHVYLYCNDDDPAELYAETLPFLQGDDPFVTFRHYPFQGQQFHMYMHCLRAHKDESEWVMFLDLDEFLCVRGSNSIKAFLREVPDDWDSIAFNWQMFGNNGYKQRPPGSVLLNYTHREAELKFTCKTLTRTAAIDLSRIEHRTFFWHHWDDEVFREMRRYNVIGVPVAEVRKNDEGRAYIEVEENRRRIYDRAMVHHYAFKSEEDYLFRADRGSQGEFDGQARYRGVYEEGQAAENLRPLNMVRDTTLAEYLAAVFPARASDQGDSAAARSQPRAGQAGGSELGFGMVDRSDDDRGRRRRGERPHHGRASVPYAMRAVSVVERRPAGCRANRGNSRLQSAGQRGLRAAATALLHRNLCRRGGLVDGLRQARRGDGRRGGRASAHRHF